jgi:hypothetical protein
VSHLDQDSPGNDLKNIGGTNAVPMIIAQIYKQLNPFDVVAFNTNGWIKSKFVVPLVGFPPNSSGIEGSYAQEDLVD